MAELNGEFRGKADAHQRAELAGLPGRGAGARRRPPGEGPTLPRRHRARLRDLRPRGRGGGDPARRPRRASRGARASCTSSATTTRSTPRPRRWRRSRRKCLPAWAWRTHIRPRGAPRAWLRTGDMGETSDGQAGPSAALPEDADPDSPARSFFSRIFGRDSSDDGRPERRRVRRPRRAGRGSASATSAACGSTTSACRAPTSWRSPRTPRSTRWWRSSRRATLSRLPVYSETLDQPLGLVHLKDLALKHGFGAPGASRSTSRA